MWAKVAKYSPCIAIAVLGGALLLLILLQNGNGEWISDLMERGRR